MTSPPRGRRYTAPDVASPHVTEHDQAHSANRSRDPRRWDLWRRPKPMIAFLLTIETLALAGFVLAIATSALPSGQELLRFAILAAGGTVHILLTSRQEARRRSRIDGVIIDLTAVWIFPAALLLPIPLILLLVLLLRTQRWLIARRPPHNFVFSSISIATAAAVAHLAFAAIDRAELSADGAFWGLPEFGAIVLAGCVYEVVQLTLTGGVLALGAARLRSWSKVLGTVQDNMIEAVTIGLGAVTAILLVNVAPAVAIMALVTVVFNRLAELGQLQSDVRTDSKTGLFNMRGWTESAERVFRRGSRDRSGPALLMIDFDDFKWINDTYGHPAGDDVLRHVGGLLTEETRPGDIVGRFGGEEFLVLLPDIDLESAGQTAERIRNTVARAKIVTTNKRGGSATITGRTTSIGVAVYPQHADSLETLVQAADAAVYEAKEQGRDQVRYARRKYERPTDAR
ncbi:GGDEF domain-containing protein [Haloechinothrix sp. YIM 98757]|uniref:GGDEF domain-containing protein n=1 Tax=Haloechinothrix aidingensis TaxID=2752311 RepID=A0A837ZY73_9PSEU|nr:GGDEF domain-containing protein [Haloechinothrix aidingensis]MBA0125124.1 GGDEF domain-containing protein [Haloechinothrix aidingensis]